MKEYLDKKTDSLYSGIIYLWSSAMVAAILILLVKHSNQEFEDEV